MISIKVLFIVPNEMCLDTSFTTSRHGSLPQKKPMLVKSVYWFIPISHALRE